MAVLARTWAPWRKLLGDRTVLRNVQGTELFMPWSHVLPDYARARSTYGQNLIDLAAAVSHQEPPDAGPLQVLDIGANIGDSALQILNRIDARVLCVEADPYWTRFLRLNAGSDPRVSIEEVLLLGAGQRRRRRDTGEASGDDDLPGERRAATRPRRSCQSTSSAAATRISVR